MSKYGKGKKIAIIVCSAVGVLVIACLIGLLVAGSKWGIPPFGGLFDMRITKLAGNADEYAAENAQPVEDSPLSGMNILYLGSSVTNGAYSLGDSFPEYIAKRNNTAFVKEAVNGTTLAEGVNSYISRLQNIDKGQHFDLFVCQLSTNDASQNKPLGAPSQDGAFDTSTICGAIEYIITYVQSTFDCPVVFYTNANYSNELYGQMVEALNGIAPKYGVGVIDMFSDGDFNDITDEQRKLYMADEIHPTRAGYLKWWTPYMESFLYDFLG